MNNWHKFVIALAATILITGVVYADKVQTYVAGEHGSICYLKGQQNKNIRYLLTFDTIEDCNDYINKK